MKNKFKKLLAFAVFAIMAMAMAVTAMATEPVTSYSIGVRDADGNKTIKNSYKVYQVASYGETSTADAYTDVVVNAPFSSVATKEELVAARPSATPTNTDEMARRLAKAITEETPVAAVITEGADTTVSQKGYYLIVESAHHASDATLTTKYILMSVVDNSNVTSAKIKTSKPTVEKKIVLEGTQDTLVDSNVVAVGDVVTYELKTTFPEYPANVTGEITYTLTDVMSDGLTPSTSGGDTEPENAAAAVLINGALINVGVATATVNDHTVTIEFDSKYVKENPNTEVKVRLYGKLNNDAQKGAVGNPNSVDLTYTNDWSSSSGYQSKKTPEDTVITYTGELKIKKTNGDGNEKLKGAKFVLYGEKNKNISGNAVVDESGEDVTLKDNVAVENTITVKVNENENKTYYLVSNIVYETNADGLITVSGLDQGTYYAVEVEAPVGYNRLADPQKIALSVVSNKIKLEDSDGLVSEATDKENGVEANKAIAGDYQVKWQSNGADNAVITNTKGTTLPGTGGMGTTIFTIGGIVLVALAALMFVVYMRKQKKQA